MCPEFLTTDEKLSYCLHSLNGGNLQDLVENVNVCYHATFLERSHSGLVHRSRKPVWLDGHRGFESHPLRHCFQSLRGVPQCPFSSRFALDSAPMVPSNCFNVTCDFLRC